MLKPNGYDEVQAYGSYEPLPAGNYMCIILKVEETQSKKMKPMLNIYLDIARGEYKGFYTEEYRNDRRDDKKWGCIVYQLTLDNDGKCSRGLKTFISAVAASNPGFDEMQIWGDHFAQCFKDKMVGGRFRREQYENRNGELRWSTKCAGFCSVDDLEEMPIMEDKPYEPRQTPEYFTERAAEEYANAPLPWEQ